MTWLESIDRAPWLVEHVIGTEGETHGNGLGDINGDGRTDIVTPVGWYECPRQSKPSRNGPSTPITNSTRSIIRTEKRPPAIRS